MTQDFSDSDPATVNGKNVSIFLQLVIKGEIKNYLWKLSFFDFFSLMVPGAFPDSNSHFQVQIPITGHKIDEPPPLQKKHTHTQFATMSYLPEYWAWPSPWRLSGADGAGCSGAGSLCPAAPSQCCTWNSICTKASWTMYILCVHAVKSNFR